MPKRPYLYERMSKDDPNYELVKSITLEAWVDSHGLVADAFAGQAPLPDYVEACIKTFRQGAQLHVDLEGAGSTSEKCAALDRLAEKFIAKFSRSISSESKRFGKRNVKGAIEELARRVSEISNRAKQRICEGELARSAMPRKKPPDSGTLTPGGGPASRTDGNNLAPGASMDHADLPEAARDLIKPDAIQPKPFSLGIASAKDPVRHNRLIVTHIASDRVADIKLPKMAYKFPDVFPKSARAKVIAARLRAEDALYEKKGSIKEFADAEELLLQLVLQVFEAFVESAYKLGMQESMSLGEIESECLRFLKSYSVQAGLADDWPIPSAGDTEISDYLQSRIERTNQWKIYRRRLQSLADAQAEDLLDLLTTPTLGGLASPEAGDGREDDQIGVLAADEQAKAERAERRKDVVMPILKKKRWKQGRLAKEAAIAKNSVYEYLDGTRVKITDENRRAIADSLGLKPEEIPD